MKAWLYQSYDGESHVVFAETRNKARAYINDQDYADVDDYIDISVRRWKEADKFYDGKSEMDWCNPRHRHFLCEHGWVCINEVGDDCSVCSANEVCDKYLNMMCGVEE